LARVGVNHETDCPPPHYSDYLWEQQEIELGRVALTRGRSAEALIRADRVAANAERTGHRLYLIPANLLRALAHAAQGEERQAREELAHALAQGEPEGYVRTFTDFGAPLQALLSTTLESPSWRHSAPLPERLVSYGHHLLATFAPGSPDSMKSEPVVAPDQLTTREHEILTMLADGLSNHDIAAHLFISRGTVKWHTNRIFAKLGVRNRLGAVARGRALHLLT
jgi:LuxR family maltose regulon positive regulatory protein